LAAASERFANAIVHATNRGRGDRRRWMMELEVADSGASEETK
jgi:hypothetical protein